MTVKPLKPTVMPFLICAAAALGVVTLRSSASLQMRSIRNTDPFFFL